MAMVNVGTLSTTNIHVPEKCSVAGPWLFCTDQCVNNVMKTSIVHFSPPSQCTMNNLTNRYPRLSRCWCVGTQMDQALKLLESMSVEFQTTYGETWLLRIMQL